jgi:hypothetical protein
MCSLVRDDARKLVTGTAPGGLETFPSDGSHLLACGVRISVGDKVQINATIFRARVEGVSRRYRITRRGA